MASEVRLCSPPSAPPRLAESSLQAHDRVVAQPDLGGTANNDCLLLQLPDETLDYIFQLAYHHPTDADLPLDICYPLELLEREPAHRPLCRRLYPIQQHQLYRHLEVTSVRNLALVARTLVEDRRAPERRLGTLVERLSLGSPGRREWASPAHARRVQEWHIKRGEPHHPVPPSGAATPALARLLGALSRLESFSVFLDSVEPDNADEVALLRLIFEDPATLARWSSVNEFCFETFGPTLDAAFPHDAGAWLAQLARLPRLETLELSFSAQRMPAVFQASSTAAPPPVLERVRTLKVYAPFHDWHVPLGGFVPNLARLEVQNPIAWFGHSRLRSLIESAPPSLVDLAITSESGGLAPEAIDDLLPAFPLLHSLRLDVACFDPAGLPSSLARLAHLTHLHFGEGDVLPDSTRSPSASSPARPASPRHTAHAPPRLRRTLLRPDPARQLWRAPRPGRARRRGRLHRVVPAALARPAHLHLHLLGRRARAPARARTRPLRRRAGRARGRVVRRVRGRARGGRARARARDGRVGRRAEGAREEGRRTARGGGAGWEGLAGGIWRGAAALLSLCSRWCNERLCRA